MRALVVFVFTHFIWLFSSFSTLLRVIAAVAFFLFHFISYSLCYFVYSIYFEMSFFQFRYLLKSLFTLPLPFALASITQCKHSISILINLSGESWTRKKKELLNILSRSSIATNVMLCTHARVAYLYFEATIKFNQLISINDVNLHHIPLHRRKYPNTNAN